MALPMISRRLLPSGLPDLKYSSWAPGRSHAIEGRVGDVVADLALHRDLGAALHLDVVDDPRVRLREVLRERLLRLVHVVVGVERREVEVTRRHRWIPPGQK